MRLAGSAALISSLLVIALSGCGNEGRQGVPIDQVDVGTIPKQGDTWQPTAPTTTQPNQTTGTNETQTSDAAGTATTGSQPPATTNGQGPDGPSTVGGGAGTNTGGTTSDGMMDQGR